MCCLKVFASESCASFHSVILPLQLLGVLPYDLSLLRCNSVHLEQAVIVCRCTAHEKCDCCQVTQLICAQVIYLAKASPWSGDSHVRTCHARLRCDDCKLIIMI